MWKKRLFEDTSKKNDGNCVCVCSYYYYFFKGRWLQNAWKLSPTTPLTPPTLRGMARVPNFRTPLLLFELNLILQAFVLWREHLEGAQGQGDSSVCVKADFCKFFVFLRPTEMGSWQQLSACHTMRPCLSVCLLFSTFGGAQVTQGPQLCTPAIFTSYAMPDASSVFCRCLSSLLLSHVFFNKSDAGGFRSTANFRTPQLCLPLELWQIILHALQASATHLPFCHPKALHFLHSTPPPLFFFFYPPYPFLKAWGFCFCWIHQHCRGNRQINQVQSL